jgi:hypothetical protein
LVDVLEWISFECLNALKHVVRKYIILYSRF